MFVLSAFRSSLFAAASLVVLHSSVVAQTRPDLDALVYGKAASVPAAEPNVVMQQPIPQQPRQRGLFSAVSAGSNPSGGGAISALGGMFSRKPRAVAPQPMDAQAAMTQPTQTQPNPAPSPQPQMSQPQASQTQTTPPPIYTPPPENTAETPRAPAQRGLLTGSRSVGSGNGALAALGKGFRSSPRNNNGGDYAPVRARYAPQPLPLAPPTYDQTYRVDAGDRLRIVVYGQDGLTNTYQIGASGSITMPLIGGVPARGRTPGELAGAITARLRDGFIREPSVAVEIEAYRPFFILGEVAAPGQYPYVPHMSVESAIAIAGGFSPRAKRDAVTLTHSMPEGLLRAVVPPNTPLSPGDTIMVGERWF